MERSASRCVCDMKFPRMPYEIINSGKGMQGESEKRDATTKRTACCDPSLHGFHIQTCVQVIRESSRTSDMHSLTCVRVSRIEIIVANPAACFFLFFFYFFSYGYVIHYRHENRISIVCTRWVARFARENIHVSCDAVVRRK